MDFGKLKINCLGASNTRVTVSLDREGKRVVDQNVNYPSLLAERLGCEVRNYGVSGCNIAVDASRSDSYYERLCDMDKDVDLVILQGEGNDANHNIPLGEVGDTDPQTYCGAIRSIIIRIRNEFPRSRILALDGVKKVRIKRTCDGCTHLDFHEAFIKTAALEGVETVGFFADPRVDPTDKSSMPDGAHMSVSTCGYYADRVASAVIKMFEND